MNNLRNQEKKKEPLVSIIVPVYNVGVYLERCVDSLLGQSYPKIEIILIDDGSTDGSGEKCDEYRQKDKRIIVLHQKNGGLSSARNSGIRCASGDFISFVDSDDWVCSEYVEYLLHLINRYEADISIAGYKVARSADMDFKYSSIKEIAMSGECAVEEMLYQRVSSSACVKMYASDLFQGIEYPVGVLYEDVIPTYQLLKKAEKVACSNKPVYAYFKRPGSIVNSRFSNRKFDYIRNCQELASLVDEDFPEYHSAAVSRWLWANTHVLVHIDDIVEYKKEYLEICERIRKNRWGVIKDKKNLLKVRAIFLLSYFGCSFVRRLFRLIG